MRNVHLWSIGILIPAAIAGCHPIPTHVDGGVLGRVVVYRNGVAFYERHATVEDGTLTVHVPRDRVDDFLKSLTVVDPATRRPLAVTIPRKEADGGSFLTMTLETPGDAPAEVLLTYVTEAPAWKPSYRVVVGNKGKVMLEGWAIVDNTTSEDWKGVLVGVGASSALAFRDDLWSVRQIDRDLLQGEHRFAVAPPTGVSPYSDDPGEELAQLDPGEVRADAVARRDDVNKPAGAASSKTTGVAISGSTSVENLYPEGGGAGPASSEMGVLQGQVTDLKSGAELVGVTVVISSATASASITAFTDERGNYRAEVPPGTYTVTFYYADAVAERTKISVALGKTTALSQKLKMDISAGEQIVITGSLITSKQTLAPAPVSIVSDFTTALPQAGGNAQANSRGPAPPPAPPPPPPIKVGDDKLRAIVDKLRKERKDVVIEVHGPVGGEAQAANRGAAVKNKLIDDGVPAERIHIVPKIGAGERENVRVVAVAPSARPEPTAPPAAIRGGADAPVGGGD
ncbi:MAG TPA: carboxypeptidase regulatory-like domain-containing protein, partial [Kofleriaceae bacterium]